MMTRITLVLVGTVACLWATTFTGAQTVELIPWAYGKPLPTQEPYEGERPTGVLRLPGSDREFTASDIFNRFDVADWWPGDHPPMPNIVRHGKEPDVFGCALCHYPNGKGKPENAPVAGQPEAYFIQQMLDFRSGARKSADPTKRNAEQMGLFARTMTDEEIRAAAAYYGSVKYEPTVQVIETSMVPKSALAGSLFVAIAEERTEPLGNRILEVPEDTEHFETYRDPPPCQDS